MFDVDATLTTFWSSFNFEEKEYVVTLPLKTAYLQKHLRHFGNVTIKENTTGIFNKSCKWVIDIPISAMDPQKAHTNAIKLINFFISLLQYNNHQSKAYTEKRAIVVEKGHDRIYNLKAARTPLERGSVLSDEKSNEKMALMVR